MTDTTTSDLRAEAEALIADYNAAEAAQAIRRAELFDAVARLGGHRRVNLASHSYTFPAQWTGGERGGREYETHRERFVRGGDAAITDYVLEG